MMDSNHGGEQPDIDPREFMAALQAAEDQAQMGVSVLAERLGTYRVQLLIAGFQPDQTFELVGAYHDWLLSAMLHPPVSVDDD